MSRSRGAGYPIRAVAKLTGLSIDTLRAWERRYGAVAPGRDDRGRVYSDADVARLRLLTQVVEAGHSVGRVATLSESELRRLAGPAPAAAPSPVRRTTTLDATALGAALAAFDTSAVDHELSRLATTLTPLELVTHVLLPTVRQVGDRWHRHQLGIAQEHLISSTMRHLLGAFLRLYLRRGATARLLFATPAGDRHEIGILGAAMLAASQGMAVSYLGADLPVTEIITAARSAKADVVVLGVTVLEPARVAKCVRTLAHGLATTGELWVGGPAATRASALLPARANVLPSLEHYVAELSRLTERRDLARR